jgi:2-polyprenyl-3-methyl-5-hydroxy-6-metoxy-1,4-benzoquinol methylase
VRTRYYRCSGCRFLFADVDATAAARFYRDVYPRLARLANRPERRLPLFARFLDRLPAVRPLRLLDVGCGDGQFLALARARGIDASGFEVSPDLAAAAYEQSGAPVSSGDLPDLSAAGSFDLVTLWNVLDQAADPAALARRSRALLRPAGTIFVRVPNGAVHAPLMRVASALGSPAALSAIARLTPFHPYVFRPRDLRELLLRAGLGHVHLAGSRPTPGALRSLLAAAAGAAERLTGGALILSPSLEAYATRD